jgi:hypothetical protein
MIPALPGFLENGIERHPHFFGLLGKPFFNGVRSVPIHPVIEFPET